jgi:hypothetical protein
LEAMITLMEPSVVGCILFGAHQSEYISGGS